MNGIKNVCHSLLPTFSVWADDCLLAFFAYFFPSCCRKLTVGRGVDFRESSRKDRSKVGSNSGRRKEMPFSFFFFYNYPLSVFFFFI